MKMNNKTIAILIVVAVVVYLLWKRGKGEGATNTNNITDGIGDVDYILTHIVFNSAERDMINRYKEKYEGEKGFRQEIQAKAYQNGLTAAQQICVTAIWVLYIREDANGDSYWSDDRGWELTNQIKKLS